MGGQSNAVKKNAFLDESEMTFAQLLSKSRVTDMSQSYE